MNKSNRPKPLMHALSSSPKVHCNTEEIEREGRSVGHRVRRPFTHQQRRAKQRGQWANQTQGAPNLT